MSHNAENEEVTEEQKYVDDDDDRNEGEDCDDDCQFIFPQRLMSILADERNHDAICWLPHGRAFVIRNRKIFSEKVMPRFFPRKSKYSSFTRKLNRWNFVRVSSGPELGAYYHEFFLRDKPHLAAQMFCKNARTKIAMASPDPTPTAMKSSIESQVTPTPNVNRTESPQMFLSNNRQEMDPTIQWLLEQQFQLATQKLPQLGMQGQNPMIGMFQGTNGANSLTIQQQILLQKQQEQERLIQLQQLMALNNMKRQQQKRKNNFRASAA